MTQFGSGSRYEPETMEAEERENQGSHRDSNSIDEIHGMNDYPDNEEDGSREHQYACYPDVSDDHGRAMPSV
jgi:hypothetical protein